MSTLFLIRHGESEWNRAGRIQGQYDSPLTDLGISQAQAIGTYLARQFADQRFQIYSSPLSRALQTAAIIAEHLTYPNDNITAEPRLNDFKLGEISGTYGWDQVADRYPELARLRLEDPLRFHPPGGESGAEFRTRLSSFLDELALCDDDGDTIRILVSHGVANKFIRSIKRDIHGANIIALGESQQSIYRLDGIHETELDITQG